MLNEDNLVSAERKPNVSSDFISLLDDIEVQIMRELFTAAPLDLIKRENLKLFDSEDGLGALMYFKRWMLLGRKRVATPHSIAHVIDWLRKHAGSDWTIDLSHLAMPTNIPQWLTASGLKAADECNAIFWRDASAVIEDTPCDYEIREVTGRSDVDLGNLHQTAGTGWAHLADIPRNLVHQSRWRSYAAFDGRYPVASSAMFINGPLAWRGFAATLPEYRRRGLHAALVARMTADAFNSGVSICMSQVARDRKDLPAKSERNLQRAGFRLSHLRTQYVPDS
jgi:hypothetical protein